MTPEILNAIEDLYTAFAAAKRPSFIDMSPVKDPADFATLLTTPLRELTSDQLWQYSFSVFFTVGDVADFEYFFPRIIELASKPYSSFELPPMELGVVFQKPAMAGWPEQWRPIRRHAFQAYLDAMTASWATMVTDVDTWLCAFSYCLPDIDRHLELLLSDSDAAHRNLMVFYEANSESLIKHRLNNAFWDQSKVTYARVIAWLEREDVQLKIQQLYAAGWTNEDV